MMAAWLANMKPSILSVALLLFWVFTKPLSIALDGGGGNQPDPALHAAFAADDFDWRLMVPYLFAASTLPGEQGIKAVLENSKVLRVFIANEIRGECMPDKGRCAAKREGFTLQAEVNRRIDEIVREGMVHRHKTASVDYSLQGQSFPFSEIAALKSENRQDAYLVLQLADHSYTAAQVQAKYGVPYDTDIFQWYSVFTYRLDSAGYKSKAVFEVDPVDGAVIKVAISLKAKKTKKRD